MQVVEVEYNSLIQKGLKFALGYGFQNKDIVLAEEKEGAAATQRFLCFFNRRLILYNIQSLKYQILCKAVALHQFKKMIMVVRLNNCF